MAMGTWHLESMVQELEWKSAPTYQMRWFMQTGRWHNNSVAITPL